MMYSDLKVVFDLFSDLLEICCANFILLRVTVCDVVNPLSVIWFACNAVCV
jgi:hypothetical protein